MVNKDEYYELNKLFTTVSVTVLQI